MGSVGEVEVGPELELETEWRWRTIRPGPVRGLSVPFGRVGLKLLGFAGRGVTLRATGGALGSVGSIGQGSAGQVGSALLRIRG